MKLQFLQKQPATSLLEILLVVGIIMIFTVGGLNLYTDFIQRNNLDIATDIVTHSLQKAHGNAQSGFEDTVWSVEITDTSAIIYAGIDFVTRDQTLDDTLNFPGGIIITGLTSMSFSKLNGQISVKGNLDISTPSGNIRTLTISEYGNVNY